MAVSIRDVAIHAGVSSCTVSKVLNDVPSRIPAPTRERVRRSAAELGYQPNRFARCLGRRRTETIGLMISGLQNPFFVGIAEAAEHALLAAGYQVMLDAAPSHLGSFGGHAKLRGWPVDGVLIWARPDQSVTDYLSAAAQEIPVVYLGYPRTDGADTVYFDLWGGGYQVGEHLAECGCSTALYVSPHSAAEERFLGFESACRAHGIAIASLSPPDTGETRAGGYAVGEEIAARPPGERPRAVVCHNDVIAVGLYRALRRAGLRVPEDIAVVGFDGIDEGLYLERPLTTVQIPAEALCSAAADLLLRRLRGGSDTPPPGQQVCIPSCLRVGGTTETRL